MLSDKDDFFASITDLYLLLNGKTLHGKKATYGSYFTTLRYALILLYAITSEIVREKEKDPRHDCTPFNIYRLNKIAKLLHLEFDRTRVAKKVYAELKDKGFVKIERKDGKEYICLTEKGKENCQNKIEETRQLKKYFMTIPQLQDRYTEQGQENQIGIVGKGSQLTDFHDEERLAVSMLGRIADWGDSVEDPAGITLVRQCIQCKRITVVFDMVRSEFVCNACGWEEKEENVFEELRRQDKLSEIYTEAPKLGFATQFEFAVYKELQSVGIGEAESKNITKSIYEKIKGETSIIAWKTRNRSERRIIMFAIYEILSNNMFPEEKINELIPKIMVAADMLSEDVYMPTYCLRCKSHTVIFDMVRSEFVCSSCGWIKNDNYFSEHADRTSNSRGRKERLNTREE